MFKIFKQLRLKDWIIMALSLGLIVFQVWLDLRLPDYMSEITMLVQSGGKISEVLIAGGKMLACSLGSLLSAGVVGLCTALIAANLSRALRSAVFNKTMSFSMEEMNKFSTASLITRSTNDITQVQMLIAMGLQAIIKAPILAVWAIIKIANKGFEWSIATGVAVGVMLAMMAIIIIFAIPKSTKIQRMTDDINRITRENLTGVRVVRAYNAEEYQEKKFDTANAELTKTHLFISKIMAIMQPIMTAVFAGLTLAIYLIGAYLINKSAGDMSAQGALFANMVVFTAYAMQVIMAFMMLAMIFIMYPRAAVSAKRINQVLDTKTNLHDTVVDEGASSEQHNQSTSGHLQGEIEFCGVSFQYPDAADNILHDINFKVKRGETLAIIGATGSGKSTLINLIPRFYDASQGEVLIDGVNVKEYKQKDLRDMIGYVSQKAVLFSGTVASNIALGKSDDEIDKQAVDSAVSIAQADEFVRNLEGKTEYQIAQGGTNLSGGQKQRVSIARAIYKKPEILIFDDSFSALDYKTDRTLRTELSKSAKDITKVIVAQRIGTIKDADQILVIDQGNVVGLGKHGELLKTCQEYQEIAYSQLTKEELENE